MHFRIAQSSRNILVQGIRCLIDLCLFRLFSSQQSSMSFAVVLLLSDDDENRGAADEWLSARDFYIFVLELNYKTLFNSHMFEASDLLIVRWKRYYSWSLPWHDHGRVQTTAQSFTRMGRWLDEKAHHGRPAHGRHSADWWRSYSDASRPFGGCRLGRPVQSHQDVLYNIFLFLYTNLSPVRRWSG